MVQFSEKFLKLFYVTFPFLNVIVFVLQLAHVRGGILNE